MATPAGEAAAEATAPAVQAPTTITLHTLAGDMVEVTRAQAKRSPLLKRRIAALDKETLGREGIKLNIVSSPHLPALRPQQVGPEALKHALSVVVPRRRGRREPSNRCRRLWGAWCQKLRDTEDEFADDVLTVRALCCSVCIHFKLTRVPHPAGSPVPRDGWHRPPGPPSRGYQGGWQD